MEELNGLSNKSDRVLTEGTRAFSGGRPKRRMTFGPSVGCRAELTSLRTTKQRPGVPAVIQYRADKIHS